MLRDPLNVMPQAWIAYSDAQTSLTHIATFLSSPIKETPAETTTQPPAYEEQVKVGFTTPSIYEWTETSFRLNVPTALEFPVGKISVVCGSRGKTSVMAALMGDMTQVQGDPAMIPTKYLRLYHGFMCDAQKLYLHKVAYVAQTPWIEYGTIRENILFSESWDDTKYRAVLHQCDLLRDLSLFDNGDLTLTSDRGISGT